MLSRPSDYFAVLPRWAGQRYSCSSLRLLFSQPSLGLSSALTLLSLRGGEEAAALAPGPLATGGGCWVPVSFLRALSSRLPTTCAQDIVFWTFAGWEGAGPRLFWDRG